ncbi:MAG: type I-E CRISPR-associated protein Cse1/CasA [bacterium]
MFVPGEGGVCTYTGKTFPILVRKMVFTFGHKYVGGWTDPCTAYITNDKGKQPLRAREDRDLWRDIGPLALLKKEDYVGENGKICYSRPVIVDQFLEMKKEAIIPGDFPLEIEVYGIRAKKMKVFEWQFEKLLFPAKIVEKANAGQQIQRALDVAEKASWLLKQALKKLYPRGGGGNKKALDSLVIGAQRNYWSRLQVRFDNTYLPKLSDQNDNEIDAVSKLLELWKIFLKEVANKVFEDASQFLDADAESIRRQVEARDGLKRSLYNILQPPEEKKEKIYKKGGKKRA